MITLVNSFAWVGNRGKQDRRISRGVGGLEPLESRCLLSSTQTATFPEISTTWNSVQTINQFNPASGTLQSVDIQINADLNARIAIENTQVSPFSVSAMVQGTVNISEPGQSLTVPINEHVDAFALAPYDGTFDFGGASGVDTGFVPESDSATAHLTGNDMIPYEGTGTVSITGAASGTSHIAGGGNVIGLTRLTAGGSVMVTYNFTQPASPGGINLNSMGFGAISPIPEPTCAPIFVGLALSFGLQARRNRRSLSRTLQDR